MESPPAGSGHGGADLEDRARVRRAATAGKEGVARPFRPERTDEDDRRAFQALASGTRLQRRLYAFVSQYGLSATAARLGVEADVVMSWIRTGEVPEGALGPDRRLPVGDSARAARYRDEIRLEALRSNLGARALARKLGCGHQTILRWRREREGGSDVR